MQEIIDIIVCVAGIVLALIFSLGIAKGAIEGLDKSEVKFVLLLAILAYLCFITHDSIKTGRLKIEYTVERIPLTPVVVTNTVISTNWIQSK